ncbi:MAG: VWA domain-containing protein [Oscillospiraceae bacterium]|nr:VWA domain-containing protein [Oscillospiraceae bacterium]
MENFDQNYYYETPKIINTGEPHMALVFLLDTSLSMRGMPIKQLNEGLNRFKDEVCTDKRTRDILDVAVVEFNNTSRIVQDFCPVEYMEEINLRANGGTIMAPAIEVALDMVEAQSRLYIRTGTMPYKPWVILISDGAPNDDISEIANRIKDMEDNEKVSFRSLGVEGYDSKILHTLSGNKVMKLEGIDFTCFFNWVNKSMRSVSQSSPGEKPEAIPLEGDVYRDRDTSDMN